MVLCILCLLNILIQSGEVCVRHVLCVSCDNHPEHAEADTFYCFSNLMVEIGDKFTKMLDRSRAGIGKIDSSTKATTSTCFVGGSLQDLMTLLKKQDPELHKHLVTIVNLILYLLTKYLG